MANKEAVFSLRVDTGSSVQDVQSFDKAINDLNKDVQNVQKTAQSGAGLDSFDQKMAELNARVEAGGLTMRELTMTMKQYQTIAAQAGMESPVGQQALQAAAQLKDEIGDLKAATTALSSDFVALDTTLAGVETGAAVFQGFQSAIALTGVESEALVQTMVKLQAVQGVVNAVQTVANNLNSDAILGIQLRTFWEKAYTKVVGESTGALKGLKLALAATGVGALIVLIGALIANFDDLKKAIFGSSEAADAMRETMDAYKEGAQGAIESTTQVGNAFELARQGVISKEEALFTYNETLGDTFGKATDVNKAEEMYIQKKDAFIAATAARAQAQALFAKAAEEQVKAITATLEDQQSGWEKTINVFGDAVGGGLKYVTNGLIDIEKDIDKAQGNQYKNAQKRVKQQAEDRSKLLNDLAKSKLKEAEITENANGIISENEKKTQDDIAAKRKEAAEKQKKLDDQRKEDLKKVKDAEKEYALSFISDRDKEIVAEQDKYAELFKLATKHGYDTTNLQLALRNAINDINLKYDQIDKEATDKRNQDEYDKELEKRNKMLALKAQEIADEEVFYDEYNAALLTQQQTEELAVTDKYFNLIEQAKKYGLDVTALEEKQQKELADIRKKYDAENLQKKIDIGQQILSQVSALNSAIADIENARLQELQNQTNAQLASLDQAQQQELNSSNLTAEQRAAIDKKYAAAKYAIELKNFQEVEKIKKQQFERDKALRIAQVAIDTATAIVKGIAQFGPPPSPAGIAAIASAAIIGATQIAAIAAQKYQSGTAPSLNTGGGGVSAGATAGQLGGNAANANLNTQQQNTAELIAQSNQGAPVYVLESDITGTQNKVAMQNKLSVW